MTQQARCDENNSMLQRADQIRAAVEQRFAQVARRPDQEQKFPVGTASATKLGYDPQEIDVGPEEGLNDGP